MSCDGCRKHVQEALEKVEGVKKVAVSLEKAEAEIGMFRHVEIGEFQQALKEAGGNYEIHLPQKESDSDKLMVHHYKISGMSCDGCRKHVQEALEKVEGVKKVAVSLEKAEAEIGMFRHVEIGEFQQALKEAGGNYEIHLPQKKKDMRTGA